MNFFTLQWKDDTRGGSLLLLDQTLLPDREVILECRTHHEVIEAIKRLAVRGAPAIGVAGGYAAVLAALRLPLERLADFRADLHRNLDEIRAARPTAVNLPWAVDRMRRVLEEEAASPAATIGSIRERLLFEAKTIDVEDVEFCRAIGVHGADLLPAQGNVLTHCNAGALATAGRGTALSLIYEACARGQKIHVFADETRPLLQGARLTAWECARMGVPVTVLCDNSAGWLLSLGKVDCIVVGADRIAANGDVANKIGTYPLAVMAREHGVPFYVAAPTSTIDFEIASGREIPIEERSAEEVTSPRGIRFAPEGVSALNFAFDVTPARLVTAIVTERGVVRGDYGVALGQWRSPSVPR